MYEPLARLVKDLEVSDAEFLEDTTLVVIRPGSDPTDKHEVTIK